MTFTPTTYSTQKSKLRACKDDNLNGMLIDPKETESKKKVEMHK